MLQELHVYCPWAKNVLQEVHVYCPWAKNVLQEVHVQHHMGLLVKLFSCRSGGVELFDENTDASKLGVRCFFKIVVVAVVVAMLLSYVPPHL